jgi:5'-3' exonuclease
MEDFFTKEEDTMRLIRDYIFISFLLGNDFVPSFEALKIREGGIEQVLRAYKIIIQKRCQYLVEDDFKINSEFFFELIQVLSEIERNLLKKQKKSRDHRLKLKNPFYQPQSLSEALQEYQSVDGLYKDKINAFEDGWEARYYNYFFHMKTSEAYHKKKQIETICEDYMIALHWILKYYFEECPDWHWSYQHEATPLLTDLALYISAYSQKVQTTDFTRHEPVEPFHQLLIILPPQSAHLLPQPFSKVMTNDDSPIIHYYPIDFEFEYYGKRFKWECHPKVPMIDPKELSKYLVYIKDQLTVEEKLRNQFGQPLEF